MKIFYLFVLLSFSLLSPIYSQSITAMTYNIRYDNPNDGEDRWDARKVFLINQIKFHAPDILGIQEGLAHQVDYLNNGLKDHKYVGVGRDDGKKKGEFSALFFNTKIFKVIESSTFWLSPTPDKISVGWDAAMERICTYALFENKKTGQRLWVFNTHFDHRGKVARENSARLIYERVQALNKDQYPCVVMGDLNLEPESEAIQYLSQHLQDTRMVSKDVVFGPEGTSNGFQFDKPVTRRIDYIFTSKSGVTVNKYAVLSDSKNLRYPSDHLPVYAELIIQ
ncbi:endonuclease/exonuclease/phosphatase family protein [Fulvivirgaceae bacterium BMA12]|uniref:Endonuclease/exonuclease/phosphatase family protein n=1 Tax=Agaribacillus aureus TaxID=3051825 RepID=A0ABT8LAL9_9BACT|nr:endonuclease/exonuclease/phosphatase family protein [Fulvivirgaceae bacterium BMA12]